jgi:hypothetical protein
MLDRTYPNIWAYRCGTVQASHLSSSSKLLSITSMYYKAFVLKYISL